MVGYSFVSGDFHPLPFASSPGAPLQVDHFTDLGQQVLTMDLRGHGQSMHFDGPFDMPTMAGDVAALVHALDINSAIIAGHSMLIHPLI